MYAQYVATNLLMGELVSKYYALNRDVSSKEFKDFQKEKMTNTNPLLQGIEFAKGVDTKSLITQKVKQDFSTALKNGMARGERTITNYKRTNPLLTRGRDVKFVQDLVAKEQPPFDDKCDFFIKWVNGIKFKVILGRGKDTNSLRQILKRVYLGEYKVQGSSIAIQDKNGKHNIILNLTYEVPTVEKELDENVVVGVDLGIAIPAMCGLNIDNYTRLGIGSKEDFFKVRQKFQARRKKLQSALVLTNGGHGRKQKLKALNQFKEKESNFAKTYNHMVSNQIVKFALDNNAKYINFEDLSGFSSVEEGEDKVLRNWGYYQLQNFTEYKAKKHGIIIRKINPYHTSQICSCCGHWERGQRISQDKFVCKACGYEANADYNASRNIAMSTEFVENGKKKKK